MIQFNKHSFSLQLSLFVIGITILFAALIASITYQYVKHSMADNLAAQVLSIVNTSSTLLNGDEHKNIIWDLESGLNDETAFLSFVDSLNKIKQANQLQAKTNQSPLYILRKADDFEQTGNMEFVTMTNKNDEGRYYTGYIVKAKPHQLAAYQGVASATDIYQKNGKLWISAAAARIRQWRQRGCHIAGRPQY